MRSENWPTDMPEMDPAKGGGEMRACVWVGVYGRRVREMLFKMWYRS
jgi:hypothetical protein